MAQYRLRLSDTLGTKEIPIPENAESLRIGTEPDCQVRLPREHYLCGFVLLLPGGVGLGAQGEARIIVAQYTAGGFHIHAILQN